VSAHPDDNINLYSNHGCRCANCKKAWAAYNRRRRAERSAPEVLKKHGESTTYTNYACRCLPCTEAHTAAYLQRRRAAGAQS
jgi:hypothetical protein